MDFKEELAKSEAESKKVADQIRNIDAQKQQFLQELLRLDGEQRFLRKVIQEKKE